MSFPESFPQNRDVIRWKVLPVVIHITLFEVLNLNLWPVSPRIDGIFSEKCTGYLGDL